MKRLSVIALVFAVFAANAAYDYYWFGTAGDGLWTTPANWSSSSNEYIAVTRYPNSSNTSSGYRVHASLDWLTNHYPRSLGAKYVICTGDYEADGGITYLPFYMAHCL